MAREDGTDSGSVRRFALGTVDSTNDEAFRLFAAGEAAPFWVTAERQARGRGRGGVAWVSEAGNLYASCCDVLPARSARIGDLPLAFAVALHTALCEALPDGAARRLRIKWPNDLLLDGGKVAGILSESRGLPEDRVVIVAGFGVNLSHHPAGTRYPATDLAAAGYEADLQILFDALAKSLSRRLRDWREGDHVGGLREAWLERATGVGERIVVRLPREDVAGLFETLEEDGRLRLRTDDGGRRLIAAGEVFPARAEAGGR